MWSHYVQETSRDDQRYRYDIDYVNHSELVVVVCIEEARILINVPKHRDTTGVGDADVEFIWLGVSLDMDDIATLACETCLLIALGTQHFSLVPTKWSANGSSWL